MNKYYQCQPINIRVKSLINIIQEKNWVIAAKKGKGKLPLFCGNGERVIPIYAAAELSVLIGVGSWGKPSSSRVIRRGIDVFPLWKSLPNSDSAAEATMCISIMHYVWIGPFAGGGRFRSFEGSSSRELR